MTGGGAVETEIGEDAWSGRAVGRAETVADPNAARERESSCGARGAAVRVTTAEGAAMDVAALVSPAAGRSVESEADVVLCTGRRERVSSGIDDEVFRLAALGDRRGPLERVV